MMAAEAEAGTIYPRGEGEAFAIQAEAKAEDTVADREMKPIDLKKSGVLQLNFQGLFFSTR